MDSSSHQISDVPQLETVKVFIYIWNECKVTALHTQKAYNHTGTSSPQLDSQCIHHGVRIQV